jgi:hypothetical protein
MAQARGPILNPGFYWIDAFTRQGRPHFNEWLARSKGIVAVVRTALHADEREPRDWILFQVKFPAPWTATDAANWGFPTVAPRGADTTEEDSRSAPAPTPSAGWGSLASLFSGEGSLAGVALLAVGLYALTRSSR